MKATERPGPAQVTAMPRAVTAPRQVNLPSLQEVRDAPGGDAQALFLYQPATSSRPSSQETPVTRISPPEVGPSPQRSARAPCGASGDFEVDAGGPAGVVSLVSSAEPQPAAASVAATASTARAIRVGPWLLIGALKSSERVAGRGR
jgi:hypothetical protein